MKILESGATIAGMQVIELLGQGAFGRVYSVSSPAHSVPLALKIMIVEAAGDKMQRRFQREAEIIKSLDNAYVPKIYDYGKLDDGSPFILMEHLQGRTLGQLLAAEGGKLHWRRVLNLGVQACEALEIAHAVGVLHRDLKPDNLFVVGERDEERLKILDFGIATFVSGYTDRHGALTKTSSLVGTPYYMPPEQVRSAAIGVEADVYMLGVVLYECLTGVRPFGGETLGDLLDSVLRGEYAPVGTYAPRTPRIMTNAVQRAMSLLPKHRFSSAGAFGGALRQGRAAMSEPPPETTLRDFVETEKPTMPASSLHVPPAPARAKASAVTTAAARDTDAPLPRLPQNKAGRFIAAGLVVVGLAALAVFALRGTGSPPQTPGPLSVSLPSAEPVASVGMETSFPGEESPTMKAAAATTEVERPPSIEPEVTAQQHALAPPSPSPARRSTPMRSTSMRSVEPSLAPEPASAPSPAPVPASGPTPQPAVSPSIEREPDGLFYPFDD